MIRADKSGPGSWVVARYVAWKVRSAFRALWIRGAPPPGGRLLVYANHPGFWDGFVAHQLARAAGWDGHALMDERNLKAYPFLARIGAFSIRPGEGASTLESFRMARALLQRPDGAVIVFPEGELRPGSELGPLQRGIEVLARTCGARCLPLALRYAHFEHELPDALIEVGEPHGPEPLEGFQRRLGDLVSRVASVRSPADFEPVFRGRRGVAERWDALRGH